MITSQQNILTVSFDEHYKSAAVQGLRNGRKYVNDDQTSCTDRSVGRCKPIAGLNAAIK